MGIEQTEQKDRQISLYRKTSKSASTEKQAYRPVQKNRHIEQYRKTGISTSTEKQVYRPAQKDWYISQYRKMDRTVSTESGHIGQYRKTGISVNTERWTERPVQKVGKSTCTERCTGQMEQKKMCRTERKNHKYVNGRMKGKLIFLKSEKE